MPRHKSGNKTVNAALSRQPFRVAKGQAHLGHRKLLWRLSSKWSGQSRGVWVYSRLNRRFTRSDLDRYLEKHTVRAKEVYYGGMG